MGLLFTFGQAVPEIFKLLYLKKLAFLEYLVGIIGGTWKLERHQKDSFFLRYSEITMEKLTYLYNPLSDF